MSWSILKQPSTQEYIGLYYAFASGALICGYAANLLESITALPNTIFYWVPQIFVLGLTAVARPRPAFLAGTAIGIGTTALADAIVESRIENNSLPLFLYLLWFLPLASIGVWLAYGVAKRWFSNSAVQCSLTGFFGAATGPWCIVAIDWLRR